jgi:hypothetical protein
MMEKSRSGHDILKTSSCRQRALPSGDVAAALMHRYISLFKFRSLFEASSRRQPADSTTGNGR